MDINEIIDAAVILGIKLTNAEVGTELYRCWADRVVQAWYCRRDVDLKFYQEMIAAANAYAI
jgi:hypothetical protein